MLFDPKLCDHGAERHGASEFDWCQNCDPKEWERLDMDAKDAPAPQSAPDVVTCEEAREMITWGLDMPQDRMLRFIDQAELLEADHARLRIALNARRLHLDEVRAEYRQLAEENARLRTACEAAVNFIEDDTEPEWPTTPAQVAVLAKLREALEEK